MRKMQMLYVVVGSIAAMAVNPCGGFGEVFEYKMYLKPKYSIKIRGDSTMHRWHAKSKEFNFDAQVQLVYEEEKDQEQLLNDIVLITENKKIVLTVPVRSLKSRTLGLAKRLRSTMKEKKYSDIIFEMSDYTVRKSTAHSNGFYMEMNGTLTMLETSKDIRFDLDVEVEGDTIKVVGATQVLMTDFGMKPPTLLFIKTDDRVDIEWEILLGVEKAAGPDPGEE